VNEKSEIKKSQLLNGRVGLLNGGRKEEAGSWKWKYEAESLETEDRSWFL